MSHVLLIQNPTAGRSSPRLLAAWREQLARHHEVTVMEAGHAGIPLPWHDGPAGRAEIVACAGGDGTVHWVVNGLRESPRPLLILPCGTANDFARTLGLPGSPSEAAALLTIGHTRRVDLGLLGDHAFLNVAFTGWPATLASRSRAERALGPFGYPWKVIRGLPGARTRALRLCLGDACEDLQAWYVAIANGPRFGGGYRVAREALLDEGLLDVLVAEGAPWRLLGHALRGSGPILERFGTRHHRVPELRLEASTSLSWRVDGEHLVLPSPLTARVVPRALEVFVP